MTDVAVDRGKGHEESAPIRSNSTLKLVPMMRSQQQCVCNKNGLNTPSQFQLHPFASKRFHVLLNSLFKVLFNFPSRYLFAIGLVAVFSLRWSLPPILSCIPKQLDSKDNSKALHSLTLTGLTPSLGLSHNQVDLERTIATHKE